MAPSQPHALQRPPAEVLYADQFAELKAQDGARSRPPGRQPSLTAARAFIANDRAKLRRYFEQKAARREGTRRRAYYGARNRLP
ncbi:MULTISPECIES: hypothetical protein [Burkholderia]|uniref:Uncharacterized protein n=1 Tax=Burkholderia paludis TaxID=1506587 RepID=A0A6P2K8G5_9BURK|nr:MULTISPECIES: hypothetical protein [Burkholderia]CAB3751636.1 hypothetical protein LMG30113_01487 [Burkholderia paludis]VWB52575.1 hypothetical protein BPA30113_02282 [Burkholderia paludis]